MNSCCQSVSLGARVGDEVRVEEGDMAIAASKILHHPLHAGEASHRWCRVRPVLGFQPQQLTEQEQLVPQVGEMW